MNKKLVIVLIIAVVLAGGAATWFFMQRQPAYEPTSAVKAVPVDATLIIETDNLQDMLEQMNDQNAIWKELKQAKHIRKFAGFVKKLKPWLSNHNKVQDAIAVKNALISFHIRGKEKVQPIFMTNIPGRQTAVELFDALKKGVKEHYKVTSRIYNNTHVFTLKPNSEKYPGLSFARHKGIFLLSPSSILLEEALRQLDTTVSVLISEDFKKVSATAGKNTDANLYINYREISDLLDLVVNQYARGFLNSLRNFAGWSELDVKLRNNAFLMNGFVHPADKQSNYLQVFRRQDAVDISLHRYFPQNTSAFFMLGISDFGKYRKDYRKYLKSRGNIHKYQHHINKVNRELKVDMEKIFYEITDEQMAAVFTDVKKPVNSNNTYAIFKVNSKKEALKRLVPMLKQYAKFKSLKLSELISEHALSEEDKFLIYRMPVMKIASKLFGLIFDRTPTNYFTFYEDVLVIGRSKEALVAYRNMMNKDKSLPENVRYKDFAHALSSSANFYMYADISQAINLYSYFLPTNVHNYVHDNLNIFSKFEALGLQYVSNTDMIYSNIYLKYNPETRLFQNLQWEKALDAGVISKPVLFRNHNTGANDIFVQDEQNMVYLVDKNGKVLWKKKLEEKIQSRVHQIDYFNNEKFQLLFSTENRIHILDRKGRYLEGYPLELSASASNGVSVFDYLGDSKYRFAIATVDNRVLLLDKHGEPVEGWQFDEARSAVTAPIQHLRTGNKDFICFSDQDQVYLLHRRGTVRIKPKQQFAKSPENIFYIETRDNSEKNRFVTTNNKGQIKKIAMDGTVTTIKTPGFKENHHFIYEDINNSGKGDYILASGKKLVVYNENMKEIFSRKNEASFTHAPVIYEFSAEDKKIGVANKKQREIVLLNNDGSMYGNFPLKGRTAYSIGFLSANARHFSAVAGTQKGLIVYELE